MYLSVRKELDFDLSNISIVSAIETELSTIDAIGGSVVSIKDYFSYCMNKHIIDIVYTTFTIGYSFLLDGIDKYATVPNAQIDADIFGGTNKKFTIIYLVKATATPASQKILQSSSSFMCGFSGSGAPNIFYNSNAKELRGTTVINNALGWALVTVSIDAETPANCSIYINGVSDILTINSITATTSVTIAPYSIGRRDTGANYFNGNIGFVSVIDRVLTDAENVSLYNGGYPLNPQAKFGADCKWFFNPDKAVFGGVNYTETDVINTVTLTTVNIMEADKVADSPYIL